MHIGIFIPNLYLTKINEIEKEWENFIKLNCNPVVDRQIRYSSKNEGGLGMIKIATFWQSVRLS